MNDSKQGMPRWAWAVAVDTGHEPDEVAGVARRLGLEQYLSEPDHPRRSEAVDAVCRGVEIRHRRLPGWGPVVRRELSGYSIIIAILYLRFPKESA